MNLYKIKIDYNNREFYLVEKDINKALERAQKKYERSIIGIWLIETDVE